MSRARVLQRGIILSHYIVLVYVRIAEVKLKNNIYQRETRFIIYTHIYVIINEACGEHVNQRNNEVLYLQNLIHRRHAIFNFLIFSNVSGSK